MYLYECRMVFVAFFASLLTDVLGLKRACSNTMSSERKWTYTMDER